ncbi:MAG: LysR family transcriptional regulator [Burkholderiales bacterium]|nr:MAG: LysR family transcriptional regulator [Burkholderiales bacterium]TAG81457.1 MAG: LysR family transcriptional regulator [Betaproteobacteria bacterium]
MRDIDDPRFFLHIVRGGSLAAAARALNVTPSAVTQRLQALEARLGLQLVDRSARKLRLTDEGELFASESEKILEQYDRMIDALQSRRSLVRGHLRVQGTFGFGRRYLAPALAAFQSEHPQLKITLHLTDRWVETESGGYDVVVHIGELANSSRVAFRIAANERLMLASPAYLKREGMPKSPDDLPAHSCLLLQENDEDVGLWRMQSSRSKTATVRVQASLLSNDGDVIKQWALAGRGIMLRSEWDTASEIAAGKLVRVLPEWRLPEANVYALVPQRKGLSSRAREFIQFLGAQFQPEPPWRAVKKK